MCKEVWPNLWLGGVDALHNGAAGYPFQACINVAAEVRYDGDVQANLTKFEITRYSFAMNDDASYNLEHVEEIVDLLHMLLQNGVKVLVHCFKGISRSVSVIVRYLIRHHAHTYDTALAHLHKTAPAARPNSSFEKQLRASEHE
jgi:protein-tyrosine phosphatase